MPESKKKKVPTDKQQATDALTDNKALEFAMTLSANDRLWLQAIHISWK